MLRSGEVVKLDLGVPLGREAGFQLGAAFMGIVAVAWLGSTQLGLTGPTDSARDCRASFNRAVVDGELPEPAGDVSGRFRGSDDWNGETPVCWIHATTVDACHTFSLDIEGRWAPPVWQADETDVRPCSEVGS